MSIELGLELRMIDLLAERNADPVHRKFVLSNSFKSTGSVFHEILGSILNRESLLFSKLRL